MERKTFVFGAVFGAAFYALIDTVVLPERSLPSTEADTIHADHSAIASPEPDQVTLPAVPRNRPSIQSEPSENVASESIIGSADLEQESTAPTIAAQSNPADSGSQSNADNVLPDLSSWLEKRREELLLEPKDDSWGYYMEQVIFEFLSNHSRMSEFDISYIECRTTTCQIQVIGFDQSTGPTWQRIMYDFGQQYPDQFYESGWTGHDLDGRPVFIQKLKRHLKTP